MKKKWFYIISIIIASALIVTGVGFLFIVNYGVKVPDPVEIYTANSKTYISTNLNENSSGYIFKFKDGENEATYETKNNLICADNLVDEGVLNLGTSYEISVCYKNDYENGYSNFSQTQVWKASKFLDTPELIVLQDYDFENNKIVDRELYWSSVENADKYKLYYSNGNELVVYETTKMSITLSSLIGGEHNFYVVAISNLDYYLDSPMSNSVKATCYHEVKPFINASFNKATKELTINTFEDVNEIEIWTGTNQNDAQLHLYSYLEGSTTFTKTKINSMYRYVIKVYSYVESETYIAVCPRVSGYNVYTAGLLEATIN